MGPIWRPFAHLHEPGVLRLVRRDLRETHDANLLSPVLLDRVQLNAAAHAPRHRQVRGLVPWSERDLPILRWRGLDDAPRLVRVDAPDPNEGIQRR